MTPLLVVQTCAVIGIAGGLGVLLLCSSEERRPLREACVCVAGITLLCVGGAMGLCAMVIG